MISCLTWKPTWRWIRVAETGKKKLWQQELERNKKALKWNIHWQKHCQNFRNPLEFWNQPTIKTQRKSSKEVLNLIAIYDFHISASRSVSPAFGGGWGNNKKRGWNCLGCGTQRHSNVLAECDFQDYLVSVKTRHISRARWSCWLLEACPVGNLTPSCTASTFKYMSFWKSYSELFFADFGRKLMVFSAMILKSNRSF